ncbi:hypothetical protein [Flavobacterium sp.]|uniref:hypothetical protein n=1 Tax=Flavobacterium sp. TaxID=239 RepID=UPI0039E58590
MKNPACIELKCECNIPFRTELTTYLQKLASGNINERYNEEEVPHKEAIVHALSSKLLFVTLDLTQSIRKVKPNMLRAIRKILKKEIVGTIMVGKGEVTLILL